MRFRNRYLRMNQRHRRRRLLSTIAPPNILREFPPFKSAQNFEMERIYGRRVRVGEDDYRSFDEIINEAQ